jgi:hypothetical protein
MPETRDPLTTLREADPARRSTTLLDPDGDAARAVRAVARTRQALAPPVRRRPAARWAVTGAAAVVAAVAFGLAIVPGGPSTQDAAAAMQLAADRTADAPSGIVRFVTAVQGPHGLMHFETETSFSGDDYAARNRAAEAGIEGGQSRLLEARMVGGRVFQRHEDKGWKLLADVKKAPGDGTFGERIMRNADSRPLVDLLAREDDLARAETPEGTRYSATTTSARLKALGDRGLAWVGPRDDLPVRVLVLVGGDGRISRVTVVVDAGPRYGVSTFTTEYAELGRAQQVEAPAEYQDARRSRGEPALRRR